MDWPSCQHCEEPAIYQCLKDKHYLCSLHRKEGHQLHKFQAISGEVKRRQALAELLQRDLRSLEQGLSVSDTMQRKAMQRAEEHAQEWLDSFDELISLHKSQLEGLREASILGRNSELHSELLTRLRCNFSSPLLRMWMRLPN